MNKLIWKEISEEALASNIKQLRGLIGAEKILCPCIKSDAYGHGLVLAGKTFIEAGADWLAVNSLEEALELRTGGVEAPIYILGYVALEDLEKLVKIPEVRFVIYNEETLEKLKSIGEKCYVHLKLETGNNRQGLEGEKFLEFAKRVKDCENVIIEGIATHFANIEDTTDHSYAIKQLEEFERVVGELKKFGIDPPIKHCANSAATILFEKTHFNMVRPGIICYGLWPSKETFLSYQMQSKMNFEPLPALSWRTKIAQVKEVEGGEFVGYGCTFKTVRKTKLAILPVGYYDGYDRGVKGAHVLINGLRAAVVGRVCMNIIMVDVTDIPGVKVEDVVTLIGKDGFETISAEDFAGWAGTINYEVVARINARIK